MSQKSLRTNSSPSSSFIRSAGSRANYSSIAPPTMTQPHDLKSDDSMSDSIESGQQHRQGPIEAGTEFEGTPNATLLGVKKKLVTEWRRADKILIIVGIFFINFITALDSSATSTIQPNVLSQFNAMTRAGLIGTVTYLLIAGIRPIFAKISDVFGHLQALCLAMFLHTLGFIICASAKNFSAIFGGTIISVLGQAGYGTLVAIILADILPIHLRAIATAFVSIPNVTNYYLGVEVGYGLIDKWHWVYGILTILAVVCSMPAIYSLFKLDKRARHILKDMEGSQVEKRPMFKRFLSVLMELDIPGLVLICGGIIAILAPLGMQLNITYGWNSGRVIAPLCIGVVALLFFIYYEKRLATFPVLPFRLFKIRTFSSAIISAIFFYYTSNVSLYYFNPYIQVTREVSSRTAMLLQLGSTGYYVGLFIGGWAMQFSKRYRRWAWCGWALWFLAVCLMIRSRSGAGTTNAEIAVVQTLLGIGSGIVIGCVGIGIQASVTVVDLPIAITLYGMVAYLGGVLGEGTSTTIWVNVLPSKLNGKMNPDVDVNMAINNITYYFELPKDQRVIVQDAYVSTQKILTICGIVAMLIAAIAMFGLAPYDLSAKKPEEEGDAQNDQAQPASDADDSSIGSKTGYDKIRVTVTENFKKLFR